MPSTLLVDALAAGGLVLRILGFEALSVLGVVSRPLVFYSHAAQYVFGNSSSALSFFSDASLLSTLWGTISILAVVFAITVCCGRNTCGEALARVAVMVWSADAIAQAVAQVCAAVLVEPPGFLSTLAKPPVGAASLLLLYPALCFIFDRRIDDLDIYMQMVAVFCLHNGAVQLFYGQHAYTAAMLEVGALGLLLVILGFDKLIQQLASILASVATRIADALAALWAFVVSMAVWLQAQLLRLAPFLFNGLIVALWNAGAPFLTASAVLYFALLTISLAVRTATADGSLIHAALLLWTGVGALVNAGVLFAAGLSLNGRVPSCTGTAAEKRNLAVLARVLPLVACTWITTVIHPLQLLFDLVLWPVLVVFFNVCVWTGGFACKHPLEAVVLVVLANVALLFSVDLWYDSFVALSRYISVLIMEWLWAFVQLFGLVTLDRLLASPLVLASCSALHALTAWASLQELHRLDRYLSFDPVQWRVNPTLVTADAWYNVVSLTRSACKAVGAPLFLAWLGRALDLEDSMTAVVAVSYLACWAVLGPAAHLDTVRRRRHEPERRAPVRAPAHARAQAHVQRPIEDFSQPKEVYLHAGKAGASVASGGGAGASEEEECEDCPICVDPMLVPPHVDLYRTICLSHQQAQTQAQDSAAFLASRLTVLREAQPPVSALPCGHCLHTDCLRDFLTQTPAHRHRCVMCRTPVTYRNAAMENLFM